MERFEVPTVSTKLLPQSDRHSDNSGAHVSVLALFLAFDVTGREGSEFHFLLFFPTSAATLLGFCNFLPLLTPVRVFFQPGLSAQPTVFKTHSLPADPIQMAS